MQTEKSGGRVQVYLIREQKERKAYQRAKPKPESRRKTKNPKRGKNAKKSKEQKQVQQEQNDTLGNKQQTDKDTEEA